MKTEALKTGWLHKPLTSKPPPVLANTSIITSSAMPIPGVKYPTNMGCITPALGHKFLMPSDIPQEEIKKATEEMW